MAAAVFFVFFTSPYLLRANVISGRSLTLVWLNRPENQGKSIHQANWYWGNWWNAYRHPRNAHRLPLKHLTPAFTLKTLLFNSDILPVQRLALRLRTKRRLVPIYRTARLASQNGCNIRRSWQHSVLSTTVPACTVSVNSVGWLSKSSAHSSLLLAPTNLHNGSPCAEWGTSVQRSWNRDPSLRRAAGKIEASIRLPHSLQRTTGCSMRHRL